MHKPANPAGLIAFQQIIESVRDGSTDEARRIAPELSRVALESATSIVNWMLETCAFDPYFVPNIQAGNTIMLAQSGNCKFYVAIVGGMDEYRVRVVDELDYALPLTSITGNHVEDPRVSLPFATDLAGVAPTPIINADYDPLHDEGDEYAVRQSRSRRRSSGANAVGLESSR
jgi:acetyl esterase/lipase